MTITKMATLSRLSPMTVDTFDTEAKCESSRTLKTTDMATPTRLIPVSVHAFDAQRRYERRKEKRYEDKEDRNAKKRYEDGDLDPLDASDC